MHTLPSMLYYNKRKVQYQFALVLFQVQRLNIASTTRVDIDIYQRNNKQRYRLDLRWMSFATLVKI